MTRIRLLPYVRPRSEPLVRHPYDTLYGALKTILARVRQHWPRWHRFHRLSILFPALDRTGEHQPDDRGGWECEGMRNCLRRFHFQATH
jgi:hypothetical protein